MTSGVRFAEVVDGVVVRHAVDQVNNDLTAALRWCATHVEPVWVYGDGSYMCPHERDVGWAPDGHDVVAFPWPVSGDPGVKP
jgi:hypothetical protein